MKPLRKQILFANFALRGRTHLQPGPFLHRQVHDHGFVREIAERLKRHEFVVGPRRPRVHLDVVAQSDDKELDALVPGWNRKVSFAWRARLDRRLPVRFPSWRRCVFGKTCNHHRNCCAARQKTRKHKEAAVRCVVGNVSFFHMNEGMLFLSCSDQETAKDTLMLPHANQFHEKPEQ